MSNLADLRALVAAGVDLAALDAWLAALDVDPADALGTLDRSHGWTSSDLFSDTGVSLGLFVLPAGHAIPLHDHPHMSGLLRVLHGRLRVRSYTWDDEDARLARREPDAICDSGSSPLHVTPTRGPLHRLEAEDDCAFLDLFVPPYGEGRVCSYYREAEDLGDGLFRLDRL